VADYTIRIVAETKEADDKVNKLDRRLSSVSQDRKINISIPSINETIAGVKQLGTALNTTYKIARQMPVIGGRIQDIEDLGDIASKTGEKVVKAYKLIAGATPGNLLGTSISASVSGVDNLAKATANLGYTVFGVTQSVNILKSAFGAFFTDTIGREIQLQEALLRTKTTLVSTADVAVNGKRITEPYEAILKLNKPINDTIDSIRQRSLEIAGTTSEAIVQVFGVVASQIGNIGGGLKDAEDLAITFSAALGTLGLSDPMYATQEIRSILTGTIDQNSILARSLGLTNEEVTKAKNSAEGLVAFLQRRLAAFTAGQAMAAKGFAGITSNIVEFQDELKRAFGKGLLDPLLDGLTILYERLQLIFKSSFGIADALGKAFGAVARGVVGAAAAAPTLAGFNQRRQIGMGQQGEQVAIQMFLQIQSAVDRLRPQIAMLADQAVKAVAQIASGLANLAKGFAAFKFAQFKIYLSALIGIGEVLNKTVIPAFTTLLNIYGEILKNPIAQYLNQLGAQFDVLNRVGVLPLAKTLFVLRNVIPSVFDTVQKLGQGFNWLKVQLAGVIDIILTGFSTAIASVSTLVANLGRTLVIAVTTGITALIVGLRAAVVQLGVFLIQVAELVQQAGPKFGQVAVFISQIGQALLGVDAAFQKAQLRVAEFGLKTADALDKLQLKTQQVRQSIADFNTSVRDNLGQAGATVGAKIKDMIKSFVSFSLQLVALQVAITVAFDLFQRFQRAQQEIADQTRAELAVKRLSTVYAEVGENATAATKAAKAFEQQILNSRVDQLTKKIGELDSAINAAFDIKQAQGWQGALRAIAASMNLMKNMDITPQMLESGRQETFIEALLRTRREQIAKTREELNRLARFQEQLNANDKAKDEVQILAKERRALEKELKDIRKQLTKEITDFEWGERQKALQLEQQMRDAMAQEQRAQLEERQRIENRGLSDVGANLKQIFDEYETALFDAQVESQRQQTDLVLKRNEIEKQLSDYKYRLEEQTLKLREKMGQMNKKIVDYEAAQRIRASKEALRYALQAAAIQGEDFVVTDEDRRNFLNAAAQQGVSAERALALLKTGAGRNLGLSSATPAQQVIAALKENYAGAFTMPAGEFENALNLRAKAFMGQSQGGSFALQLAAQELGTGRFKRTAPVAPPKMEELSSFVDIGGNTARMRASLESNFAMARELVERTSAIRDNQNLAQFLERLGDPANWGVAASEVGRLDKEILQLQNDTEALSKSIAQGLTDPSALQSLIPIKTAVDVFLTQVYDQLAKSSLLKGVSPDVIASNKQGIADILKGAAVGTIDLQSARKEIDRLLNGSILAKAIKSILGDPAKNTGIIGALRNAADLTQRQSQLLLETLKNDFTKLIQQATDIRPGIQGLLERFNQAQQALIRPGYSLENANRRSDLAAQGYLASQLNRLTPEQRLANPNLVPELQEKAAQLAESYRRTNEQLDPLNRAMENFEQRLGMAVAATEAYATASRGLLESLFSGTTDFREAMSNFTQTISQGFLQQFLDIAMAPMQEQVFERMRKLFGVESAQDRVNREFANTGIKFDTAVTNFDAAVNNFSSSLSAGIGGPDLGANTSGIPYGIRIGDRVGDNPAPRSLPVVAPAPISTLSLEQLLATEGQASLEASLEQSFKGIGESLTHLGTVAETTGKQTEDAADTGKQGFGKFLGAMTGVATGALAITGAIQAMQDAESGTYGTLMSIAGILGGLGSIVGGFAALGKRAAGGPVSANRPYVVGELGPELIIPGASGTVIPNDKIAFTGGSGISTEAGSSGMTVPFQQGGSSVSNAFSTINNTAIPFTKSTERLVAERSERETVAAINNPKPLDVRFESQVINGVEYVSAEQHRKGMAEAAERGRALALSALQNSVKTRKQVGI